MDELRKILMEQLELLQGESWKAARSGAFSQLAALSHEMAEIAQVVDRMAEMEKLFQREKPEEDE